MENEKTTDLEKFASSIELCTKHIEKSINENNTGEFISYENLLKETIDNITKTYNNESDNDVVKKDINDLSDTIKRNLIDIKNITNIISTLPNTPVSEDSRVELNKSYDYKIRLALSGLIKASNKLKDIINPAIDMDFIKTIVEKDDKCLEHIKSIKPNFTENHIVIEGIDGCGKSTIIEKLKEDKRIKEAGTVEFTKSPFDSDIVPVIRKLLSTDEKSYKKYIDHDERQRILLNLFVTDIFLHSSYIRDIIANTNATVISDRYFVSTLAYQSENPVEFIYRSHFRETSTPGHIIYLNLSPEVSLERIDNRGDKKEIYENIEKLTTTKRRYDEALDLIKSVNGDNVNIVRIDAEKSEDEVYENVVTTVLEILNKKNK
ncbi:MAG: dTMP kinase [Anaeroplasmataceae bacterium]